MYFMPSGDTGKGANLGNVRILHVEDIGARLVEAFSPEMLAAGGIDELRVDADERTPSSRPIWRASIRLSLGERSIAPDDEQAGEFGRGLSWTTC